MEMPWASGRRMRFDIASARTGRRAGDRPTLHRGDGIEADTLRPWHEGDPARAIDWRATARMDSPWIRSRHDEREMPVTVIVDDLPAGHQPLVTETIRAAARWVVEAASGSGFPISVVLRRAGSVSTSRAGRGKQALRSALALIDGGTEGGSRSSLAETIAGLRPGAAVLITPFDIRPDEKDDLRQAVHQASRRTTIVPVRVESPSMAAGTPPPEVGIIEVLDPRGRRRLLRTTSGELRARWLEAAAARARFLSELEGLMSPGALLEPGDHSLQPIVTRFSRASRSNSRRRPARQRPGRAALRRAMGLILATFASGAFHSLQGQASNPGPEVVLDRIAESGIVGTPVRRTLRVRWVAGPTSAPPSPYASEEVDVRVVRVESLVDEWLVEVDYTFWTLGEHRLPPVSLAGLAGPGLEIRPRRVRIEAPPAPEVGLGPTLPELPRAGFFPFWFRWLPPVAGGLALLLLVSGRGVRIIERGVESLRVWRRREALAAESPLDRVMLDIRLQLSALAGEHPGWTTSTWSRWSHGELSPEVSRLLDDIRDRVDERRFRPSAPASDEIQQARELADRLRSAIEEAA